MSLPDIDFQKFVKGTEAQLKLNRLRNIDKDEDKPLELWALILGRPTGNLMAAVEDKRLDDVEKYVFQVSAVLAEIYGKTREIKIFMNANE